VGQPWTRPLVHQILINEKYIGNNVYNQISFKLKKKRVRNPPEMWVRSDDVFDAVVDPNSFFVVRGMILERSRRFSDEEMIAKLRELFGRHAALTAALIDQADGMPSSGAYRSRFGSLLEAYAKVGFRPDRDYSFVQVDRHLRQLYPTLLSDTIQQIQSVGASVIHDQQSDRLLINNEYTAAVVLSRCRQTQAGSLRWLIELEQQSAPDVTILVRMDPDNSQPTDYYLLPLMDLPVGRRRLSEDNGISLDTYRFETLRYFVEMASRVRIEVAA
jgi:hypothetical protein